LARFGTFCHHFFGARPEAPFKREQDALRPDEQMGIRANGPADRPYHLELANTFQRTINYINHHR